MAANRGYMCSYIVHQSTGPFRNPSSTSITQRPAEKFTDKSQDRAILFVDKILGVLFSYSLFIYV